MSPFKFKILLLKTQYGELLEELHLWALGASIFLINSYWITIIMIAVHKKIHS